MALLDRPSLHARLVAHQPRRREIQGLDSAAVALVLAGGPHERLHLLLIRRAEREGDAWSGHMALPGGRAQPDDADLLETARREAREEVGIDLGPEDHAGALDDVVPLLGAHGGLVIRPFAFLLAQSPLVRPGPEVDRHCWVALDELAAMRTRSEVLHRGRPRTVDGFQVGVGLVWGLTFAILENLLAVGGRD
jgi:8-oxo-dGTP pyrophosphatase MutT (NUDIX family)